MDKELKTRKINGIFQKFQSWVNDEKPFETKPIINNRNTDFIKRIKQEIEVIIGQEILVYDHDKITIPTKYIIFLCEADDKDWYAKKRDVLYREINNYIEERLNSFSVKSFTKDHVQFEISPDSLKPGEIKINFQWEEDYSPQIQFNQTQNVDIDEFDDSDTIIAPNFWNEIEEAENPTIVKMKLFSLEISWEGNFQSVPVFQSEIKIGRSIYEDITLLGDETISRHHLDLTFQGGDRFLVTICGQNPVYVRDLPLFQRQTTSLFFGDSIEIGNYSIRIQN